MTAKQVRRMATGGFLALAVPLLSGCLAHDSWQNPNIDPSVASRTLQIDSAECNAIAMQSVPIPAIAQPVGVATQSPASYSVRGFTASGDYYTGTITPSLGFTSGNSSVAQGVAEFETIQDNLRREDAYQARDDFAKACTLRRGWDRTPVKW